MIDIETDKVVLELPAPQAGVLVKILKGDGATVVSDEVIATIDTEAKAATGAAPAAAVIPAPAPQPTQGAPAPAAADKVVMPAARKIAADQGLDPNTVAGSGRGGRVTKGDVLSAVAKAAQALPTPAAPMTAPVPAPSDLGGRPEQRVPMTRLRQRVAERLIQSQSTAAILTTFNEVNMSAGDGAAQEVPGRGSRRARRQARLHVVLRQGGGRRLAASIRW